MVEEILDSGKALTKLIEFSDDDNIQGVIDEASAQS
jgi:anthranilate phosphoribosyltransferase